MKPQVIAIFGPTASKKTAIALALATLLKNKNHQAEIVNFDSLLFYKGLDIGTAKPTAEELNICHHHLIDITTASTPLNAADYQKLAVPLINELLAKKTFVILVGGSGFYLRALLKGMYQTQTTPIEVKKSLEEKYENNGIESLYLELKKIDPRSHARLHINDHYRVIRALEYYYTTGRPISDARGELDENAPFNLSNSIHPWPLSLIYLNPKKDEHLNLIKRRTENMVQLGLVEEVKSLLEKGLTGSEKPLLSIGYKEAQAFLNGEIETKEELVEKISIATRQLAKSQRTFFNKVTTKVELNPLEEESLILSQIFELINSK